MGDAVVKKTKPIGLIMAIKEFFGLREGQSLKDFREEMKALDAKDRSDLKEMFAEIGYRIR